MTALTLYNIWDFIPVPCNVQEKQNSLYHPYIENASELSDNSKFSKNRCLEATHGSLWHTILSVFFVISEEHNSKLPI